MTRGNRAISLVVAACVALFWVTLPAPKKHRSQHHPEHRSSTAKPM